LSNKTPVKIRVIYADTDAMGIVYHTNYIRWFEAGRSELFRDMGIIIKDAVTSGMNLPLTQVYCHYHHPAHYDEIVTIETKISYVKRASMKFTYVVLNETREMILAEGYTVHACTDRNGSVTRIPECITEKIISFLSNK